MKRTFSFIMDVSAVEKVHTYLNDVKLLLNQGKNAYKNEELLVLEQRIDEYEQKFNRIEKIFHMEILLHYSFPGNVRELENIIERAIILEKSSVVTPESLPRGIRVLEIATIDPDRIKTVDEMVKEYAEQVVKMLGGNRSRASELLGMSRTSLWKILKEK